MKTYNREDEFTKEELQDYIISLIVSYYVEENKQLQETIKGTRDEADKAADAF